MLLCLRLVHLAAAIAEGPRDAQLVESLRPFQLLHNKRTIALDKACNKKTTLKTTQGHLNWRYAIVHTSLSISGKIKVSHRFRDITTFIA